ncbi:MAG: BrnA antitoxin family protein [Clostridiales Family XIII bacterium]|jgi:predicted HicB family RNase H-like nuclease|nr:BrnA antitoxin family protein [Clostridiales Family XIII bacterium]
METSALNIRIPKGLYEAVKADAAKHSVSVSAYVRTVLAREAYGRRTKLLCGNNLYI